MYTNDKLQRITLRLNDKQFDFVKTTADMFGVSPSEFLRMVINVTMSGAKTSSELLQDDKNQQKIMSNLGGILGRENDEANIDNKL